LGLLFDKLWVRRVPDTKWEAEHGQQVNVIASYVPRADYPELNQSAGPGGALLPCSNGVATRVATGFLAGKAISGLNESSARSRLYRAVGKLRLNNRAAVST